MVLRLPVISLSGLNSQIPPGDTIAGAEVGNIQAGSGIVVGANTNLSNTVDVNVALAPNASGVIFVDNKFIGDDGLAQRLSELSIASGEFSSEVGNRALASGAAALVLAETAFASGAAALTNFFEIPQGAYCFKETATNLAAGEPVGLNNAGQVARIRYEDPDPPSGAVYIAPTVSGKNNYIGVATKASTSGSVACIALPLGVQYTYSGLSPGEFYYLLPGSGGVSASFTNDNYYQFYGASGSSPSGWNNDNPYSSVGRAISTSGLLLIDALGCTQSESY